MRRLVVVALLVAAVILSAAANRGRVRAEILRDEFGMPHIFAADARSAAFAVGYAQAEDRLEELLKNYKRAEGSMTDAFGPKWISHDTRQRLWRHRAVAEALYPRLSATVRSHIEAFQDGVRQYMREHPDEVPSWAPTLAPWQVVALGRYITWGWSEADLNDDLQRAGLKRSEVAYRGSNAMIITAPRTTVGASIAVIDPQLYWYGEYRLYGLSVYAGDLAFTGAAIVGTPYPFVGNTRFASIAMTSGGPDTADLFEEEVADGKYRYKGEWLPLDVREEIVGGKPVRFEATRHGPIIARKDDKAYAASIAYRDQAFAFDELWQLLSATRFEHITKALDMLALPPQNLLIATVQGDAFYVRNGRVPVRPAGCDATKPLPGADGRCEWQGVHRLADLAQLKNPAEGYLQNCNTSPQWIVEHSPLTPERFAQRPYLFNFPSGPPAPRPAMVLDALERSTRVSLEQVIDLALSPEVYHADRWQARIRQAAVRPQTASATTDAAQIDALVRDILAWDHQATADSRGALAFYLFKTALGKTAGALVDPNDTVTDSDILDALRKAAAQRARDFPDQATYGTYFRVGRDGSDRTFPVSGGTLYEAGMITPRTILFNKVDGRMLASGGQTATQIVVLSNPPKSFRVMALGTSDRKDSPHFDDQTEQLFSRSRVTPTYFLDRAELEKHVTRRTALQN